MGRLARIVINVGEDGTRANYQSYSGRITMLTHGPHTEVLVLAGYTISTLPNVVTNSTPLTTRPARTGLAVRVDGSLDVGGMGSSGGATTLTIPSHREFSDAPASGQPTSYWGVRLNVSEGMRISPSKTLMFPASKPQVTV